MFGAGTFVRGMMMYIEPRGKVFTPHGDCNTFKGPGTTTTACVPYILRSVPFAFQSFCMRRKSVSNAASWNCEGHTHRS